MSIGKDIQQHKFQNEYHKASVNIIYTYSWMMERVKVFLEEAAGITPQQFNILRILRGSYPLPISTLQIRERMLDKMSDTSRIVDRLIAKELVKKKINKEDHRLVDVVISVKGRRLLKKLDARQHELDSILGNISTREARMLSQLLDKIRKGN